jgi:hypothetical protein
MIDTGLASTLGFDYPGNFVLKNFDQASTLPMEFIHH